MEENTANERNFEIGLKSVYPVPWKNSNMPHPSILRAPLTVAFVASPFSRGRSVSAGTPDHDDQITGAALPRLADDR